MAKAGLFKSSQFHYHYRVSVAHGFETALMQFMHEFVHISQVIHCRYQLAQKRVKRNGEKQQLIQARWLGKKAGFVDDIEWQERPWEAEAAQVSAQLSEEFMAMVYGTQSEFAPQKAKKQLPLHHVSFALPNFASMPEATMPEAAMPDPMMQDAQDGAEPPAQTRLLKCYVQGIDEPRHLDSERLQAKRQEMAERGLLEK